MNTWKSMVVGFIAAVLLVAPSTASANETLRAKLDVLLAKLEELQNIQYAREQYADNGPTTEGALEYFLYQNLSGGEVRLYGDESTELSFKTDLDAPQLLLVVDCAEADVRLFDWDSCSEQTWVTGSQKEEWSQTFFVPMQFGDTDEVSTAMSVYVCRWNGCMLEDEIALSYKPEKVFAVEIRIYDRYEWSYEFDGDMIHVQEVLLDFPYEDVKKVLLDIECDERGLYLAAYGDTQVTCNESERYTQPDYRDTEVDEAGNKYNLLISTYTDDIQAEQSGALELQFRFIGKNNSVIAEVNHRPVQIIDMIEEEAEEETDESTE